MGMTFPNEDETRPLISQKTLRQNNVCKFGRAGSEGGEEAVNEWQRVLSYQHTNIYSRILFIHTKLSIHAFSSKSFNNIYKCDERV